MDHHSKTATIRDLLTFLINQLEITVTSSHPPVPLPSKHGHVGIGKASVSSSTSSVDKEKDKDHVESSSSSPSGGSSGTKARGGFGSLGENETSPSMQSYIPWLTYQLRAMALLIELTRGCCLTPPAASSSTSLPASHSTGRQPPGASLTAVLSPEEADNLLRALVRTADYFLRMYRLPLGEGLAKRSDHLQGENNTREGGREEGDASINHSADHLSSSVEGIVASLNSYVDKGPRQFGALELVQELRNGFISGNGSGNGGGNNSNNTAGVSTGTESTTKNQNNKQTRANNRESTLVTALHQSVVKLREELLVTYFRFNLAVTGTSHGSGGRQMGVSSSATSEVPGGAHPTGTTPSSSTDNRTTPTSTTNTPGMTSDWRQHQLLVNECGACVARHFEILLPTDHARVAFITMLSQIITARPPEESATLQSGE